MIYLLLSQKVLANFRQSKVLCSCMVQTSETYVRAKFTNCAPSTNIGKLNQNNRTLKYKVNVCIKKKIIGQVLVFPYLCQLLFPSQHFIMKLLGGGGGAQSCLTLQSARLLCPWNFAGKNTGVDFHYLLQGISPTQGWNPHLLHLLCWEVDFFTTSGSWEASAWNIQQYK